MATGEFGRSVKIIAKQIMSKFNFISILLMLNAIFYFGGKWLPWRFGIFTIERYPYGVPYQVIFLFLLSLSFYLFRDYIFRNITFFKIIIIGFIVGCLSSFIAIIVAYAFFYIDTISIIGLNNLIKMSFTNPIRYWIEIVVLSFMLLGWLYGIIVSVCIFKVKMHNEKS